MLSIKSLTIALFSAAAINASFFIPTDLADGAYTFVNGVATPIDASASSTAKRDASAHPHSSPNLSKRLVNPVTHCDGFSYNSPDYVNAYNVSPLPCFWKISSRVRAVRNRKSS